jgi:hypothetical protein
LSSQRISSDVQNVLVIVYKEDLHQAPPQVVSAAAHQHTLRSRASSGVRHLIRGLSGFVRAHPSVYVHTQETDQCAWGCESPYVPVSSRTRYALGVGACPPGQIATSVPTQMAAQRTAGHADAYRGCQDPDAGCSGQIALEWLLTRLRVPCCIPMPPSVQNTVSAPSIWSLRPTCPRPDATAESSCLSMMARRRCACPGFDVLPPPPREAMSDALRCG